MSHSCVCTLAAVIHLWIQSIPQEIDPTHQSWIYAEPILALVPCSIFEDLTLHHGHDNEENSEEQAITLPTAPSPTNNILGVLNDQIIPTH